MRARRCGTVFDQADEMLMDGGIASQLGMEGRRKDVSLLYERRLASEFCKHFYARAHTFYDRCADEDHFHRLRILLGNRQGQLPGHVPAPTRFPERPYLEPPGNSA